MRVVDTDIHPHGMIENLRALFPYMSANWRRILEPRADLPFLTQLPGRSPRYVDLLRIDAEPPSGGIPGSDARFLIEDHFDRHDIDIGLLIALEPGRINTWTRPEETAVIARAANQWLAQNLLAADERFRIAMIVSPFDGQVAAAEIRRFGTTNGVSAIWVPLIQKLLGHHDFYPIYEAAEELGLAIVLHPDGTEGDYVGCADFAGGSPSNRHERNALLPQFAMSNIASLVFEGVFERFPNLKVVFTEYGWTWVAPLLWRMDSHWQTGRWMAPWVKRSPTDYVIDHIRFTTQPALEVPNKQLALQVLEMMHAERTLMYSSDYPHWDGDEKPTSVFKTASLEMKQRIFRDNAVETYGGHIGVSEPVVT